MGPIGMDQSYPTLDDISDRSNVASPHSDESGELKTIDHYVFDKEEDIISRFQEGKPISCFVFEDQPGAVHVAYKIPYLPEIMVFFLLDPEGSEIQKDGQIARILKILKE